MDIEFDSDWGLALGSCRFFTSTFPKLVTLTWKNEGVAHADHLFSTPPFVSHLRSLTYMGGWNSSVIQVFAFFFNLDSIPSKINTAAFRLLMCNNRSLESLELRWIDLESDLKVSPVHLLNLKSLIVDHPLKKLSTTIRIPKGDFTEKL